MQCIFPTQAIYKHKKTFLLILVTPVEQTFQQNSQEFNKDLEREGMGPVEHHEDYDDDELESFKNKLFFKNKTVINQVISINHVVKGKDILFIYLMK